MYKLYLAWKFFFSRKINVMSVIGIAVGVWLLTVVPAVMNGFVHEQRDLIRGTLSDLILTPDPVRGPNGNPEFPAFEKYEEALRGVEGVEAIAPRIVWGGIIGTSRTGNRLLSLSSSEYRGLNFVQLVGVDAEAESRVGGFAQYLRNEPLLQGDPVDDPTKPFEIPVEKIADPKEKIYARSSFAVILPETVFHELRVKKGQRILIQTIVFQEDFAHAVGQADVDAVREISRKPFVVGSYRTGEYEIDAARIYLDRRAAREMLGLERGFTEVAIRVRDDASAETVRGAVRERLDRAGLSGVIETWEEQRSVLLRAVNNETRILTFLLSAVILVAAVTIFVILSLVVNQKIRDIGVIGALGGTRRGVLATFLGVGFLTGLAGEILGGIVGYYTVKYLTPFEYWLRDHLGIVLFDPKVYAFDHLPALFSWTWFWLLLLATMGACLLASLFPAMRAARLNPVEALRYE